MAFMMNQLCVWPAHCNVPTVGSSQVCGVLWQRQITVRRHIVHHAGALKHDTPGRGISHRRAAFYSSVSSLVSVHHQFKNDPAVTKEPSASSLHHQASTTFDLYFWDIYNQKIHSEFYAFFLLLFDCLVAASASRPLTAFPNLVLEIIG